jgi:hypothetical protein
MGYIVCIKAEPQRRSQAVVATKEAAEDLRNWIVVNNGYKYEILAVREVNEPVNTFMVDGEKVRI